MFCNCRQANRDNNVSELLCTFCQLFSYNEVLYRSFEKWAKIKWIWIVNASWHIIGLFQRSEMGETSVINETLYTSKNCITNCTKESLSLTTRCHAKIALPDGVQCFDFNTSYVSFKTIPHTPKLQQRCHRKILRRKMRNVKFRNKN